MSIFKGTIEDFKRQYPNAVLQDQTPLAVPAQPKSKEFVQPGIALADGKLTILFPAETRNESNGREWRERSKRTKSARRILNQTMRPFHHWLTPFVRTIHDGAAVRVTLTRLGMRSLDSDNVQSALKAARDAVAALLLSDDADPWIHWCYGQEPGGPVGVRVEIEEYLS